MRHLKTFFIVFVCVLTILTGVSTVFATSNIEKISPSHVYDEINYGKLLKLEDVEYFMGKLNDYIKQNPDATNEELNRFLKAEMRKKYLNKNIKVNEVIAYSNYPAPVDLNPEEQKLYNENPTKGLKAIWQGKKAFNEANERYSSGLHNGNGDAFRHAYWNALMVKHIDYDWAYRWATAHEIGASGQPEIEKEMDLYNNKIGRIIGSRNKSKSDNSLADIVQQDVRNGRMRRIVKEKLVKTNSDGER